MSAWKRLALEQFPEISAEIEPATTIDLSVLLSTKLVEALQTNEASMSMRVAQYAAWAWSQSATVPQMSYFAQDILAEAIKREPLRAQLWPAVSAPIFRALLPAFSGILQRDASNELEREFRQANR